MLEVALPRPLAQGWPSSSAVHHCQPGRAWIALVVCAPAGTPGGAEGLPEEELPDEPLEEELPGEEED
ncbi:MAG TPA: hypothetical protein VKV05_11985 [Terriglobales bacterium]|nr:hypothetical protein [Terriglobales bacterium]